LLIIILSITFLIIFLILFYLLILFLISRIKNKRIYEDWKLSRNSKNLIFQNIFYNVKSKVILQNISGIIPKNSLVAIMGSSGINFNNNLF
jgi:hypothetical protein